MSWNELRGALRELRDDPRRPLRTFPDPTVDEGRMPPFRISLAPWAVEIAESLDARFGTDVVLTVGVLRFPDPGTSTSPVIRVQLDGLPDLPEEIEVRPGDPLIVQSGSEERTAVTISNHSPDEVQIHTNGILTAWVVDPKTRAIVGGFSGLQTLPLVVFSCRVKGTVTIPLLVGTSSFRPDLGYAIPAGEWVMRAVIELRDRGRFLTPLMPLTVSPRADTSI